MKEEMKEEVVRTLSGYFDSVDQQMSYEEAFKTVYENQQELERQMQTAFDQLDNELDPNYHYYMPEKPKNDDF